MIETIPDWIFLGYKVKRPWDPGPEWAPIELICCLGDNQCEPPEGWIERWDFNGASCYDTPEAAWATVESDHVAYRLFAYYLLPLHLADGEPPKILPLSEIFAGGLPKVSSPSSSTACLSELGFDIAERQYGFMSFPYSPLVTNGFSGDFPTNRYGLLNELTTAIRACEVINDQMPEHAPHWVMHVFGEKVDDLLPSR